VTVATAWHALKLAEVLARLKTDPASGLAPDEAQRRLQAVGPNRVADQRERPWSVVWSAFPVRSPAFTL
jgi:magnesium-transporting ATPase (P-type)